MLVSAISMTLSFSSAADYVEHVEVIGQRQSMESRLILDEIQPQSADLRDTLKILPGVAGNGNGPLTAITQYRGLFGDRVKTELRRGIRGRSGSKCHGSSLV